MYVRESTIVGYAYMADIWCESCLEDCLGRGITVKNWAVGLKRGSAEVMLDDLAGTIGVDRNDEYSFDSDDFPKIVTLGHLSFHSDEDLDECGECGEGLGA